MATHSSILAWKNLTDGGAWQATVYGVTKSRTQLSDFTFTFRLPIGFPGGTSGKEPSCQCWIYKENEGLIVGWEDPLEEGMATYTSILA